jgi:hypothetical protein
MTDAPQTSSAVIGRIANYLQQLILLDMLAKVLSAQEKGGDYLPLLKSLSDYVESQGGKEKAEWHLIAELCSLAARADQLRLSERCADDSVLDY